jgi:hypothetical protein
VPLVLLQSQPLPINVYGRITYLPADVGKGFSKGFADKHHKKVKYLLTLYGGGDGRMIFVSTNVE